MTSSTYRKYVSWAEFISCLKTTGNFMNNIHYKIPGVTRLARVTDLAQVIDTHYANIVSIIH